MAHLTVVQTRGTNITKTDTLTFDMNRSFSTGFRSRVGLLTCSFCTLIQFLGKLFVQILVHNKKQYVITHSTQGSYKSSLIRPFFFIIQDFFDCSTCSKQSKESLCLKNFSCAISSNYRVFCHIMV